MHTTCDGIMHCLIVEDDPINLLGLNVLFRTHLPKWALTSAAAVSDAIACMQAGHKRSIDLIIMSFSVPLDSQTELFTFLSQDTASHPTRCIIISGTNDQQTITRYRDHGVAGYISKNMDLTQQIHALKIICGGGQYFPFDEEDARLLSPSQPDEPAIRFTARQKDLIQLIFAGYSNKQIAIALGLSYGTVKNYMFDLMRLLSVNSRLELTVKVRENADMLSASTDTATTSSNPARRLFVTQRVNQEWAPEPA
jgi:DNA-binding NarL/FixJ family response regulator